MPRFTKGKSPFTKKTGSRDHEESRGAVCGTCLQKDRNLSDITQTVLERVKRFVWQDVWKTLPYQKLSVLCVVQSSVGLHR